MTTALAAATLSEAYASLSYDHAYNALTTLRQGLEGNLGVILIGSRPHEILTEYVGALNGLIAGSQPTETK